MSNSYASAILTTADLSEAIRAVRTLLSWTDTDKVGVDFEGRIRSPDTLTRVRHVLPDLVWWASAGSEHGSSETGDDPVDCLPIQVFDWCRPLDRAEPFIEALGPESVAAIRWDLDAWHAVPEAGLEEVHEKYAYLTLSVHSLDLYQDEPSQDHTVHVHDRYDAGVERVHWFAEQVGVRFTGRVQGAPL
ncbi:hypothetical protein ACGFZR_00055 [Streptomyces sp. NPDC048241]|uniref:hypothetical protein n=1 Tax=Streptomyces sp. NPDC048241 TaxID=3365521 RepID=UPI0037189909